MCNACGFPSVPGHWTDAGAEGASQRMRMRFIQISVVNKLLAPYKLKASYDGTNPGLQLFAPGGEWVLVDNLEALWGEAARLAGTPIDPLSKRALGLV